MAYHPKTAFAARVWQLARHGLGSEDIYVATRQYGVTMEYARSVVWQLEAHRIRAREHRKAKRAKMREVA